MWTETLCENVCAFKAPTPAQNLREGEREKNAVEKRNESQRVKNCVEATSAWEATSKTLAWRARRWRKTDAVSAKSSSQAAILKVMLVMRNYATILLRIETHKSLSVELYM